jgi:predicted CopG family antitoxin
MQTHINMSTRDTTTIAVDQSMWKRLNDEKKHSGESFNDVLERLVE